MRTIHAAVVLLLVTACAAPDGTGASAFPGQGGPGAAAAVEQGGRADGTPAASLYPPPAPADFTNGPSAEKGSGHSGGVAEFTVTSFGARGDGVTDDTRAILAAVSALKAQGRGRLVFPAGTYAYGTTIAFPVVSHGRYEMEIQGGAQLAYSGPGYAIDAAGRGEAYANVRIFGGGRVTGTPAARGGIRLRAFNRGRLDGLDVSGFTNGDGVLIEGANTVDLMGLNLSANRNGLRLAGTSLPGAGAFGAIGNRVIGGHVSNNSGWGVLFDGTGGGDIAQGNFIQTTFDPNGSGDASSGHVFVQSGNGNIIASYMEYSATQHGQASILIGDGSYQPSGTTIRDCYLGSVNATYSIDDNGLGTTVDGTTEVAAVPTFIRGRPDAARRMIGKNFAPLAGTMFGGVDNGDTLDFSTRSTLANGIYPTASGIAFNAITGGPGPLKVRARRDDAAAVQFQTFSGVTFAQIMADGGFQPGTPAGKPQAARIYQGPGLPDGANGSDGDFYFRTDTPETPNQRLYIRGGGRWLGIL